MITYPTSPERLDYTESPWTDPVSGTQWIFVPPNKWRPYVAGGGAELTSYVEQVASLDDYPPTFPPDTTGLALLSGGNTFTGNQTFSFPDGSITIDEFTEGYARLRIGNVSIDSATGNVVATQLSGYTPPTLGKEFIATTDRPDGVPDAINPADAKTAPIDADEAVIRDSAVDGAPTKRLTFANLWTWVKNKVESTALTFTQNLVGNGTANRLPNQLAATDDAVMTRGLLGIVSPYIVEVPLATTNTTATNVGTGFFTRSFGIGMTTGATAESSSFVRAYGSAGPPICSIGQTHNTINWSRPVKLLGMFSLGGGTPNGQSRIQLGLLYTNTTVGDASVRSIALLFDHNQVKIQVHDGATLTTSAALATLDIFTHSFLLKSDGAGTAKLYIDDALVGSTTGAPQTVGLANHNGLSTSVENRTDSAHQRLTLTTLKVILE